ncbi:MAG: hypothetical protein HRU76_06185 [Phycisphaeraceae bacterium]|nr:hypothetical protein [Phycisphaerales bacterium]QOJ17189.1 MAG: hypothetical protein HRU76_06185 [Phycisphaeraceae bacterium]
MPQDDWYPELDAAVRAAGFHTSGLEDMGSWRRTTVASKRCDWYLTGNSFWVGFVGERCVLGTWGCRLYELPEVKRLASFCIDWLREAPTPTLPDFADSVRAAYGLRPIQQETLDRWVAEAR